MLPTGTKRRRCVVLADGSAVGCYLRNTHETHTVVLEPSGHTYSYIQPDGTRTRHLTPTALSSHRPLVVDTLNVRNRFTQQPPYLHLRLMQAKSVRQQRRIPAPRARWPVSGGRVVVSKLYNEQDKCFEMQSIEGAAKVRLHASGKIVELYYVVEVKVSDDQVEGSSHAHYTTLHQVIAVGQTPQGFELPVRTLLAAKAAWDKDQEAEVEFAAVESETVVSGAVSQLLGNGAFAARPAFSVIASSYDGHVGDEGEESGLALAEILRVATLPSKLLYGRIVAEVVEDATLLVSRRKGNALPELVVQPNSERSLLVGCEGFYTWYDETGRPQHRFTRETIPPSSTIDIKNTSHSLVSLCQHIDYVLQAFKYAAETHSHNVPSLLLETDELELVEESENEHGRFRAFRDGRVRVAFADRTILQVERDGDCCSFFFADGSTAQTTLASAPLRHRAYIYQALEFGDWAFSSQEDRMQRHIKRQEAQAVVARELQRNSVCCGMTRQLEVLGQSKDVTVRKDQDKTIEIDRKDPTLALSLNAVRELQAATLQHIASVDHALQMAASAATKDT
ncbi:hypothetical protein PF005_g9763 [Phytophthora fragariae]|uniref:C5orf34-like C-terminal domain-containing protein n=1 Tax=Phytophthora fragariae TaxID=53985 RepID=A0A6A4CYG7_9STRA|nr:hypothetical protein PF003_g23688 [Phytophthora fragariae]KAE8945937.1 hypothetical protein PF009_g4407 [Phytophthora fragariae]KAE8993702.1 hypothetical protein PF011_g17034 [Phytophthora fragariae]KAE9128768.1 hypothetical protein PF007_g5158 [Phytophthora fragariae]KAE9128844.1 hypothetical protein PF006_g16178 [Phytophthora fragariae]